jgi:oligoribonuclease
LRERLMGDVSSVSIVTKTWLPEVSARRPAKKYAHRALDDILESIEEMKFYRDQVWRQANDPQNDS